MSNDALYDSVIIKTISRKLVPFVQLFALYVIMHGGSGPGGGFQGGVILGASIILFVIGFGLPIAKKRYKEKFITILSSTGLFIYSGIGLIAVFLGGKYLQYNVYPNVTHEPINAIMIDLVEIGIGITVMAIMISIFFDLSEKTSREET
ncbi:MAG TPA: hypothetical protein EYP22_08455 [Methanosarcinales archaeon]|nr:hypothetical protein [Methanosarcinales archaeon]